MRICFRWWSKCSLWGFWTLRKRTSWDKNVKTLSSKLNFDTAGLSVAFVKSQFKNCSFSPRSQCYLYIGYIICKHLMSKQHWSAMSKCISITDQTEVLCCSPAEGRPEVQRSHPPVSWPGMRWKVMEVVWGFHDLPTTDVHTRLLQHRTDLFYRDVLT